MKRLLALLLTALALATAQATEPAFRAERLRAGEQLPLNGSLAHPAWQRAPVWSRFFEHVPKNGSAPPQRTEVQLLFDEHALYVGVRAFDTQPQAMRDVPVRHDGVNRTQDFVVAYVDAIGTAQSAQFFRVNAAGSMADGLHTAADDSEDFAPDFDWDAAVQRTPQGWTAVMRLPFASLRFEQPRAGQAPRAWRFMLARRLPREQFHLITSVQLPLGAPSFIHQLQALQGVEIPAAHQFLSLRPSFTASTEGHSASLDVKWRPRAELVVDGTLNPDFSQVALDVPQLQGNSRFALFYTEKRPFFFESADLWRSPTRSLYTRSITAPRLGLRGTWREASWAGTALATQDRGGGLVLLPGAFETGYAEQPASQLVAARARRNEGSLQWGGTLALRRYEADAGDNNVLGPDMNWQISEHWRASAQWLASHTTAQADAQGRLHRGAGVNGQRWHGRLVRQDAQDETRLELDSTGAGFRQDTGFVNQADVASLDAYHGHDFGRIGPFNQFVLNLQLRQVRQRSSSLVVEQMLRPGLWSTGAHNLEWWLELYPAVQRRISATGPLLRERYVASGLTITPAAWWPFLIADVQLGRMADAQAEVVRPGVRANLSAKLRPVRALELEPSLSRAWLRHETQQQRMYDETAVQGLAVWHFNARHTLRAIAQRSSLHRRQLPTDAYAASWQRSTSLTYAYRASAGSSLYVGASRQDASDARTPRNEAFVKLQFDVDEWR